MSAPGTIVVGVDGSGCSRTALEFALDEAVLRGAGVRVIAALPDTAYWAATSGMSPSLLDELTADLEKMAQRMVDDLVRERGGAVARVPAQRAARLTRRLRPARVQRRRLVRGADAGQHPARNHGRLAGAADRRPHTAS